MVVVVVVVVGRKVLKEDGALTKARRCVLVIELWMWKSYLMRL